MVKAQCPNAKFYNASVFASCAQTNVQEGNEIASPNLAKPQQVLIYNFAVSPENIQQNSSIFAKLKRNMASSSGQSAEQIQLGREVADALASELTHQIAAMGVKSGTCSQWSAGALGSILVTGHFFRIDEDNRLCRNVIGLGLGQSSIDAEVQLLAPAPGILPLSAFKTHADSGRMLGAAILGSLRVRKQGRLSDRALV